jgi:plastocyanin
VSKTYTFETNYIKKETVKMKKIAMLLLVLTLAAVPMTASAQETTNTAFQVVNLSDTTDANVTIVFYDTSGAETHTLEDTISKGSSKTYVQADMEAALGTTFNGSVVVSADQEIAAIVNQNTANDDATSGYNASYTGFSEGGTDFYIPIVLNNFYGYSTEISIQNAGNDPVNVDVTYDTTGCTDEVDDLKKGTVVRFDNTETCSGGLNANGSATVSATGPVVAVVNQMSDGDNLEQTYNGFALANAGSTLYTPIALHAFYGFNSSFQVQNVSGSEMDICATYSDDVHECVEGVADGASATFLQGDEDHANTWTGSAVITNTTGGDMVGVVNQQGGNSAASFNMYTEGAAKWSLPSLLYEYYGFTSSFQVQNVSDSNVDITVTYDDGSSAESLDVAPGDTATFVQNDETGHTANQAFSAVVEATGGEIVVVVNQDVLTPGAIDYQYSYNAVPLE